MTSLDVSRLKACCRRLNPPARCFVFDSLPSTNAWLADRPPDNMEWVVCTCERQTAGKGRSGKSWDSVAGQDIALSFRWRYPMTRDTDITSLSLLTALVVARCCQPLTNELVQVKWPNDIVCRDKKLAGILLEHLPNREVIVGVGLNIQRISAGRAKQIDQPAIGLQELSEDSIDRQALLEELIISFHRATGVFAREGFLPFHAKWEQVDYLKDLSLTHQLGDSVRKGIGRGISEKGELVLEDAAGNRRLIHAGTVRRAVPEAVDS